MSVAHGLGADFAKLVARCRTWHRGGVPTAVTPRTATPCPTPRLLPRRARHRDWRRLTGCREVR